MAKVRATPAFERALKPLLKKYASMGTDLKGLIASLAETPVQGDMLYRHVYKIRLAIKSKNKSKSGGARVITMLVYTGAAAQTVPETVVLLYIYDKSDTENIPDTFIQSLVADAARMAGLDTDTLTS